MNKNFILFLIALSMYFMQLSMSNAQWNCGDDLIDSRDGKVYKTVLIGSKCWMAENLNIGKMIKSDSTGQLMTGNNMIEKYCWNNDPDYCDGLNGKEKYGAFYEWNETVQNYSGKQPTAPVQGICDVGWHIPSVYEFNSLIKYLGGDAAAGSKMKAGGESNFGNICTGYRCTLNAMFLESPGGTSRNTFYWTSNQSDAKKAHFFEMKGDGSSFAEAQFSPFFKSIGATVRCVQN